MVKDETPTEGYIHFSDSRVPCSESFLFPMLLFVLCRAHISLSPLPYPDPAVSPKVGVHLTPGGTFNGCADDVENAEKNMEYHIRELEKMDISYLHIKLSDEQDERHGGKIIPIE